MKILLAAFLIPIFVFNTSLQELFKLPVVFSHFAEHKQADQNLSFLDFFSMHYGGDDHNDTDQDRDMKLPFKQLSAPISFDAISITSAEPVFEKRLVSYATQDIPSDYRNFNILHPYSGSLLRPPII